MFRQTLVVAVSVCRLTRDAKIMSQELKSKSKFLSYVLRHAPDSIGLTLDANGWADIFDLQAKAAAAGTSIDRATLEAVVATSDKKRFTLSADGSRIRAAQGHSVTVELDLAPTPPPETLYHGTATRFLEAIRLEGLKPGSRASFGR
jgi:putative RNA 2'-phosphotransferase